MRRGGMPLALVSGLFSGAEGWSIVTGEMRRFKNAPVSAARSLPHCFRRKLPGA